jgi:hypothetical protein
VKASPAGSNLGAAIGLAVPGRPIDPWSEDRSARGAHDMDRTPAAHGLLTRPSDTGGNSVGQLPGRGDGTAQVARPSRCQMDTLEPHSNDS